MEVAGAGGYAFGPIPPDGDRLSLLAQLPKDVGAGLIAVLGILGVPTAIGHTRTEWSASAYRPLLAFTALQVVVFGLLAPSVTVVILVGYLLVLVGLPAGVLWLIVGAWKQPAMRVLLLAMAVVVVAVEVTTGLFDWAAFREVAEGTAGVPAKVGIAPLFVAGAFLLGCGWALLGVRRAECAGAVSAVWTPGGELDAAGVGSAVGVLGDGRGGALPDAVRAAADDVVAAEPDRFRRRRAERRAGDEAVQSGARVDRPDLGHRDARSDPAVG